LQSWEQFSISYKGNKGNKEKQPTEINELSYLIILFCFKLLLEDYFMIRFGDASQ